MVTVSPQDVASEPTVEHFTPEGTTFDDELCSLVVDTAPRLFAVVQEHARGTEDEDGWVVAWGMAFHDGGAHVVRVDGVRSMMSLHSPERAVWWFGRQEGVRARLVWLTPTSAASFDCANAA